MTKSRDVVDRLNWFAGQGYTSGPTMARLVRKCPALLYGSDLGEIGLTFDKVSGFFPKKHVSFFDSLIYYLLTTFQLFNLIKEAPHILLLPFDATELKYEYM